MRLSYLFAGLALAAVALFAVSAAVALAPPDFAVPVALQTLATAAMGVLFWAVPVFAVLAVRWLYVARERRLWARHIAALAPDPNVATYRGFFA